MSFKRVSIAAAAAVLFLSGCGQWYPYERDFDYPGTTQITGQRSRCAMASRSRHRDAARGRNGEAPGTALPVILTQTGYNKGLPVIPAFNDYLVRHGYVHVSVDVRGTGMSEGQWEGFSDTEQADYAEVMEWVATQPWSNGTVGTWGASFMGIAQLFTAARQHPAHEAIFAIVPMADSYRDIVFTGGQTNIGFIPLWMGLVTALGVIRRSRMRWRRRSFWTRPQCRYALPGADDRKRSDRRRRQQP